MLLTTSVTGERLRILAPSITVGLLPRLRLNYPIKTNAPTS